MSQNPLLNGNRMPGVTFQLPSLGLFYQDDELDVSSVNGEVHVFPMTAYDEILIRTPDLLLNGTAIDAVLKRCVPQVLKPNRLLSKDIDYLMTALRSVSLGNELEVSTSHTCDPEKEHSYTLNIGDFQQKAKRIDPTTKNQQYSIILNNKNVQLSPIRYDSLMKLISLDHESTTEDVQANIDQYHQAMMEQLAGLILQVEVPGDINQGIATIIERDPKNIVEWLKTLEIKEIKALNKKIDETSEWGADLTYKVTCKNCGEQFELNVPLNPNRFFI